MKIDSRSLDDLRPDVGNNARILFEIMARRGHPCGTSSTYRNDDQQAYLYAQGRTRPGNIVTYSSVTTFHGARLAFDIFQNVSNPLLQYNDPTFWKLAAELLAAMGFSRLSMEKCHAQWDDHGQYSGTQVRSGVMPPEMPLFSYSKYLTDKMFYVIGINSPMYWADIIDGKRVASADNVKSLMSKTISAHGLESDDSTLYSTIDSILHLTSDDYWQGVIDGTVTPSAQNMTALIEKIVA